MLKLIFFFIWTLGFAFLASQCKVRVAQSDLQADLGKDYVVGECGNGRRTILCKNQFLYVNAPPELKPTCAYIDRDED